MNKYPNLFTPIKINQLYLRNRIIGGPIGGICSKEKALGGAGLFVWGSGAVNDSRASFSLSVPYMFDKYQREPTRAQMDTYHQGGGKVSLEIMHSGYYARVEKGDFVWGPCDDVREDGTPVKALNEEEMERICNLFAETAVTARDFGFDMIMLHFAHGWLPAEFLSPAWNQRTDQYGGSYENRRRFPLKIIETVRKAVGRDFPIDMRISAYEWIPESIEFNDVVRFIKDAEPYIDMVNVSAGLDINHEANVHCVTTNFSPHTVNVDWSKQVKEAVDIPVSVVGAIMTPEEGEATLAEGKSDMITIGRSLLADPDWVNKAYENRSEDITPCIRCLYCYHISTNRMNVGCSVNPRYSKENLIPAKFAKTEKPKKIVVIGGGPAGINASLICSDRGHEVVLLEKGETLGGQINCSDYETHKQDLRRYRDFLRTQVGKSNIDLRLGQAATPELVKDLNPEAIMVAVGGQLSVPKITGIENAKNILEMYPKINELEGPVIIIGGGVIGSEFALQLAERDVDVHLIEATDTLNAKGNMLYRIAIRQHMEKQASLHAMTNAKVLEVFEEGVSVDHEGKKVDISGANILLATGLKPKVALAQSFMGIAYETYTIGDCYRVGDVKSAVEMATFASMNI
jgi:2,4-dienoyl-CoA reductase-like NADH-dependent reductase (Old Yellow Enzyme family)/thioredoxin reductase